MPANRWMPHSISDFFDPKLFMPFVIGTTSLAFSANALYDFAKEWTNTRAFHWRYLFLSIAALVVLMLAVRVFKREYDAITRVLQTGSPSAAQKKALIVLGSNESVVRKAIEHHGSVLKYGWIIASEDTKAWADKVARDLTAASRKIEVHSVSNPADWEEVSAEVRELLEQIPRGLLPEDVVVDFTGLTKPASVGAVLSALQKGASLQYTPARTSIGPGGSEVKEPLEPEGIVINYGVLPRFNVASAPTKGSPHPTEGS